MRISVDELSQRTRIRVATIKKLEANQLDDLGAEVYVIGWLRSCAQVLGLDGNDLIDSYRKQIAALKPAEPSVPKSGATKRAVTTEDVAQLPVAAIKVVERKAPRDRPNWSIALAAVFVGLLVVAGLAVIGRLVIGDGSVSEVVVADQTQAETLVIDPSAAESGSATEEQAGLTAAASSAPVEVILRVQGGNSWVRVTDIENVEVFEGTMGDGDEQVFSDSAALNVVVGNAGVVSIVHNGVDLGQVGDPGQVIRLLFGTESNIG